MTTDDVLGSRVQLHEPLHISSGDTFTDFGNTGLDDILEVVVNGFKMHVHLILLVGIVSAIEDGARSGNLDYPCSRHS
jgi:hypothetical protein